MNKIRFFFRKYFKTFTYFYRKLKYRLFVRIALNLSTGVLDGFGLAMFLPLLQIVGDDTKETTSDSLGKLSFLVEFIKNSGLGFTLMTILSFMAFFFMLKGIATYINTIYGIKLKLYFMRRMRIHLSTALSQLAYKQFILADAGRIQNTLTGEIGRVAQAYEKYFGAFQQLILTVVYMGFAFSINPQFAVLICVGGAVTNLAFNVLYKKTKKASEKVTLGSHRYQKLIIQFVANFKYLKSTGNAEVYNDKLIRSIKFIENYNYKIGKLGSIMTALREPIMILVVCAVILIQVNVLGGELASILISLLFFYKAMNALMFMQTAYNGFLSVSGSMDNITTFEEELKTGRERHGSTTFTGFSKQLQLHKANFAYGSNKVLRGIDLELLNGRTYAFVGESGSGKSTLVNILAGLMPLDSGSYTLDGIDIAQLDRTSFQKRIGYITQEPVIFSDTVFNNVSFWQPKTHENVQRFEQALKKASILSFVNELEAGGDTMLGNNGVNLSGGQRQRISIARELYKEVDILIMDEATSALDSETEKAIQQSIDGLKGQYTILIVAHRLATIKNVDRIILLDRGTLTGQGSYVDLLAHSEKFRNMTNLQEL